MRSEDRPNPSQESERLFAHYLALREAGEEVELKDLCDSHPELAPDLELLNADWESVGGVLEHMGFSRSMFGRSNFHTLDIDIPGSPVSVEELEDSASKVAARIIARAHPYRRYQITGEVGRGGMGAILSARDEDLRRDIVMKVSRPGRNLDRFLEEAQVSAQLDHPGIVPVHELSVDDSGRIYFTMKLVKGQDLRKIFDCVWEERDGWTRGRALRAILKVCEAVAYAHDKRVIHRDLKPHNIMVGRFGEVYVMDWGLARVLGPRDEEEEEEEAAEPVGFYTTHVRSDRAELSAAEPDSPFATMDGAAVGTPAYMSPEQAEGRRDALGPATDIYAIGAILYQLITKRMPYVDPDELVTSKVILERVRGRAPDPVLQLAPDVDPGLAAICEKAMSRDPYRRYGTVLELGEKLSEWLDGRAQDAERNSSPRRLGWLVAGLVGVTLLAGLVASSVLYAEASAGLRETRATATELADWVMQRAAPDDPMHALAQTLRAEGGEGASAPDNP